MKCFIEDEDEDEDVNEGEDDGTIMYSFIFNIDSMFLPKSARLVQFRPCLEQSIFNIQDSSV